MPKRSCSGTQAEISNPSNLNELMWPRMERTLPVRHTQIGDESHGCEIQLLIARRSAIQAVHALVKLLYSDIGYIRT